jgi:signal transduction histidine kinase
LSERERRYWWATELPFLACALAGLLWLPAQRVLDPLVCVLLVAAYGVAVQVRIPVAREGFASAVQLVLVPMLFFAPLNVVALLVLAGNVIDDILRYLRDRRPITRSVLSLGDSVYALAPLLVLAVAGHPTFTWHDWPLYVTALAAQMVFGALFTMVRVRVLEGDRVLLREALGAPLLIDVVVSLPALGVVAVAGDAPVAASLMLIALLVIAGGFTSERGGRLVERERAAEDARRALFDERVRIARELHDVVAHHVSMMGVQAGAARVVLNRDPDKAKEALAMIETSSRQAVLELHTLLGFLRQAGDAEDPGPQPGLGELEDLLGAMGGSELVVEVRVEGEPCPLAPTVDASAFRIVQEALTNTVKHATASRVDVHLRYRPGTLEISIVDDGRAGGAVASSPGGLGLVGMRERVGLHGGQLTAGPVAGGGFRVHATLPTAAGAP